MVISEGDKILINKYATSEFVFDYELLGDIGIEVVDKGSGLTTGFILGGNSSAIEAAALYNHTEFHSYDSVSSGIQAVCIGD